MTVVTLKRKCKKCGGMGTMTLSKFVAGKGYTKKEFYCPTCDGKAERGVSQKEVTPRPKKERFSGGGGEGVKVTLTEWIAQQKGLGIVQYGHVLRETEKAILLRTAGGQTVWLPRSQIGIVPSPVPTERAKPAMEEEGDWIIKEYEGYTDKLVKTRRYKTEAEAKANWERFTRGKRFAGVGGKYRHYFSYPAQEEKK